MPVFEGLLPNSTHSETILALIAICAEWHALAKLRIQTDETLGLLQNATVKIGDDFRAFVAGVCEEIKTVESDSELQIRQKNEKKKKGAKTESTASMGFGLKDEQGRGGETDGSEGVSKDVGVKRATQKAKAATHADAGPWPKGRGKAKGIGQPRKERGKATKAKAKVPRENRNDPLGHPDFVQGSSGSGLGPSGEEATMDDPVSDDGDDEEEGRNTAAAKEGAAKEGASGKRPVKLSNGKPKFHFLGDYVRTIRMLGTTDNYTTEGVRCSCSFSA
jgi:hypothetical protein